MSKLLSRKNFMISLCKRGIPARYAWRVSKELNDHAEDLNENQSESSLGDPDELLDQIESTYKQRTFAGRHPLLVFLMAPLPVVIMIYILSFILAVLVASLIFFLLNSAGFKIDDSGLVSLTSFGCIVLFPNILSSVFIIKWARRSGIRFKFAILSCLPVLLIALVFIASVFISQTDSVIRFYFGLNLPLNRWFGPALGPPEQPWPLPGFYQIMQFLISALIIFYMVHHEKVKQQRLAEKLVITE